MDIPRQKSLLKSANSSFSIELSAFKKFLRQAEFSNLGGLVHQDMEKFAKLALSNKKSFFELAALVPSIAGFPINRSAVPRAADNQKAKNILSNLLAWYASKPRWFRYGAPAVAAASAAGAPLAYMAINSDDFSILDTLNSLKDFLDDPGLADVFRRLNVKNNTSSEAPFRKYSYGVPSTSPIHDDVLPYLPSEYLVNLKKPILYKPIKSDKDAKSLLDFLKSLPVNNIDYYFDPVYTGNKLIF